MKEKTKVLSPSEKFELCENIGDIFELIKETTERSIGRRRAGLTLYLTDLPLYIGAMHQTGSNVLIMNRLVLEALNTSVELKEDANVFIYIVLLHEYLHALGYTEEMNLRTTAYRIAMNSFGLDHKITKFSREGLSIILPQISKAVKKRSKTFDFEIVKDFDRSSITYIG